MVGDRSVSGAVGYAERPADAVVDAAKAWLETAPERFFLWVHFYDPHIDYAPPPGFASARRAADSRRCSSSRPQSFGEEVSHGKNGTTSIC